MENENNERKVLVGSKVTPEMEERLKKLAKQEKRTVSNLVYFLLETHPRLQAEETELQAA